MKPDLEKKFLKKYLDDLSDLIKADNDIIIKLKKCKDIISKANKKQKKIIIVGNGGSAAIANHFSVDLTKNAGVRCVNFNEASLITCFSNDYGHENWMEQAIKFYGDKGDVLIAISSSGNSKNIQNSIKSARKKSFSSVVTFTGLKKTNPVKKMGDLNFWVDNKAYNFIENTHQVWLLSIVDLIIGKREYKPN